MGTAPVLSNSGLVLFIVAYLATLNLVFCIILNLVVPFLLVFLLTDKFNPKAYFVYGMEFVLLQMVPIARGQIQPGFWHCCMAILCNAGAFSFILR